MRPCGPCGPDGPATPVGPSTRRGPAALQSGQSRHALRSRRAGGPCGPAEPCEPAGPRGPLPRAGGPAGPIEPCEPCKPTRPCMPTRPCGPTARSRPGTLAGQSRPGDRTALAGRSVLPRRLRPSARVSLRAGWPAHRPGAPAPRLRRVRRRVPAGRPDRALPGAGCASLSGGACWTSRSRLAGRQAASALGHVLLGLGRGP